MTACRVRNDISISYGQVESGGTRAVTFISIPVSILNRLWSSAAAAPIAKCVVLIEEGALAIPTVITSDFVE